MKNTLSELILYVGDATYISFIPSNISIPQWTQNVQGKLMDLIAELKNQKSPGIAYLKTPKK